jgi:hypothetical protein
MRSQHLIAAVTAAACVWALAAAGCLGQTDDTASNAARSTATGAPTSTNGPPPTMPDGGCTPRRCEDVNNPCGEYPDGCGGKLTCKHCMEGQFCGGGGPNVCGTGICQPKTCAVANATCGDISDGCGHVLDCGDCKPGQPCNNNQCICTPTTCKDKGATCGDLSDGCGKVLSCGTCEPGHTCSQNVCTCTATTCAQAGATCGDLSDGCGKVLDCGSCSPGETCTGHTCCSGAEICGNGKDDDCDGAVDENCVVKCESTEGNGCNGDAGYGDRCAASDNEDGCSPARFWAWCNRRNDAYPDAWENYLSGWVDDHCNGSVSLDGGGNYPSYVCTDSQGVLWSCTTPLVVVFEPGGRVQTAAASHSFPLLQSQSAVAWPTGATPWLAIDRNGNGRIDDGTELFGSATARNGFEALRVLDSNGDGMVEASDCAWGRLLVWRDRDASGTSEPSELQSASDAGLLGISLDYRVGVRCNAEGDCERERAELRWVDGTGAVRAGEIVDLHLRLRP